MGLNIEQFKSLPHAAGDLQELNGLYEVAQELLSLGNTSWARNFAVRLSNEITAMSDLPDGNFRKASPETVLGARIQTYMLLADIDIAEFKSLSGRAKDTRGHDLCGSAQFYLETAQLCYEKMADQFPKKIPERKSIFYLQLCTRFNALGNKEAVRSTQIAAIEYLLEAV